MTAERSSAFQKHVSGIVSGKVGVLGKKKIGRKKKRETLKFSASDKEICQLCHDTTIMADPSSLWWFTGFLYFISREVLPLIFESHMLIYFYFF